MSRTALASIALLLACGPTLPGEIWQERLDTAQARWEQQGPDGYRFRYIRQCFCPQLMLRVTVQGGVVTAIHDMVADTAYAAPLPDYTIPALFTRIQELIDQPVYQLSATYDPTTGLPLRVAVDAIREAIDDEHGFTVGEFAALP